jgi:cyclophilin family peptidyl-prolyl cis-trans isomerase
MFRTPIFLLSVSLLFSGLTHAQNPVTTETIPPQSVGDGDPPIELGLEAYFTIDNVTSRIARFNTVFGSLDVEMLSSVAPNHVLNFMGYVNREDFDDTLIHRMAQFATDDIAIVQGGGFFVGEEDNLVSLPTVGQVALEYSYPNFRGTLGAARAASPNSASSGWYFNTIDNSITLGPDNDGFGYSVFGRVMGDGMTVVDAIAAVERYGVAGFTDFPLRDYNGVDPIQPENFVTVNSIREISMYPESNDDAAALSFTATSSDPAVVTPAIDGSTLRLNSGGFAGTATITVTATDISGLSAVQEFTFEQGGIAVLSQPTSVSVAAGATTTLSINATAEVGLSYQWYRQRSGESDATAIAGATGASLAIANTQAADMGFYWVQVSAGDLMLESDIAIVTLDGGSSRLANLSTRGRIAAGGSLTPGFVIKGTGSKDLVVRAVGPQLLEFGVLSALADPQMAIIPAGGSVAVATNQDWSDAPNSAQLMSTSAVLGAFALEADSKDAALLTTLPLPNAENTQGYTVRIQSADPALAGIALAEVYDPDPVGSPIELTNVSALGFSGTGEDVLSPGFVIDGSAAKTILVRVVGPSLTQFGVTGVMADPRLSLIPGGQSITIARNDDWGGTAELQAAFTAVGAQAFDSIASLDAAVLVRLPPGAYTVRPEGAAGGTGIVLVEVYEVIE